MARNVSKTYISVVITTESFYPSYYNLNRNTRKPFHTNNTTGEIYYVKSNVLFSM